jgi:hypothetical protein
MDKMKEDILKIFFSFCLKFSNMFHININYPTLHCAHRFNFVCYCNWSRMVDYFVENRKNIRI